MQNPGNACTSYNIIQQSPSNWFHRWHPRENEKTKNTLNWQYLARCICLNHCRLLSTFWMPSRALLFALSSFQLILALTESGGVRSPAVQSVWAQFWWPRTVQSLTWHLTSAKCQALPEASALLARLVEPSSSNVANLQFTLPPRLMFHRFSKVLLRKQGHSHTGNPAQNNDPFHAKCHKKLKCERLLGFFQLFFGFL